MPSKCLILLLPALLLLSPFALADDPVSVAGQMDRLFKGKRVDQAMMLWATNSDAVLGNVDASLIAAQAFVSFGGSDWAMQYQEIPEECAKLAVECLDAAEGALLEEDPVNRHKVASGLLDAGEIYLTRGHGDKAARLQDRAFDLLKALTKGENPSSGAFMDLGRLYGRLAARDPRKAEDHIAQASAMYEKVLEASGKSTMLSLRIGQTKRQLAEMLEERLLRTPKDRKLAKAIKASWGDVIEAFQDGLEQDEKSVELKTAYNETLWELLRVTGGKCRMKPLMKEYQSRYRKLGLGLPESTSWQVKPFGEIKDKNEVFAAFKVNRKAGQALLLWIDQYKWNANYTVEETGSSVGGDNIGGLAKRSEQRMREYFQDIKERKPLRKMPLNKRIPKAEAYIVKGKSGRGDLVEYRVIFFKNSKVQRTYKVTIIADLGMLERNPYELKAILATITPSKRR